MPKTARFDTYHLRYESWFAQHKTTCYSELLALRAFAPWQNLGLDIGICSGRLAAPLGVAIGIDPSRPMLDHAVKRGIAVTRACAAASPFADAVFGYALIVTTIRFVDDIGAVLTEAHRVLKSTGCAVIGFIDRTSALGQYYLAQQAENVFYGEATFYSVSQVSELLQAAGLQEQLWVQTLSTVANETDEIEPLKSGYGEGASAVVKATKA